MQQLIIEVPDEVAERITVALAATYPSIVEGTETPGAAMRAVVAWWTANMLADYETAKIRTAGLKQVQAMQAAIDEQATAVRQAAWGAIQEIMTSGTLPDVSGDATVS